jgi:hypothetical protein
MSRGFLIFAHDNPKINYGLLALCCAARLKHHMREKAVVLAADKATLATLRKKRSRLVRKLFDDIITIPTPTDAAARRFNDVGESYSLPWYNTNRPSAYDLSPFDETVVVDSDYLMQNSTLDHVWGTADEIMINRHMVTIDHSPPHWTDQRLDMTGIPLYWATVLYFHKGARAKLLFDLVEQIKANYLIYHKLYQFHSSLYRNDYSFSIALHMMSGFVEGEIPSLPMSPMLTCYDTDEILDMRKDEIVFLYKPREKGVPRVTNIKGLDVHCMNKFSILRHADKILELYADV